ncbi:hypothetical protein H1D31_01390 [Alishewanella sp. BS5-314]|uniref:hypothetical protein n=1 Tax=Alishewanella sp. BS5-314 TaxID=2755587 RepID=UPI0021BB84CE|nr:hypothetical protein [Alishewanella sp. BS5-314]MCT8124690.1 hypothetical protein [Alishewanella sp. BS5-314]
MDRAVSTESNRTYTAEEFEALSESQRKVLKLTLSCLGCGDVAWFKSATKPGSKVRRIAHFNSHHHGEECEFRTSYFLVDDETNSGKATLEQVPVVAEYFVNLDSKIGGAIADIALEPIPNEGFFVPSKPSGGAIGKGAGLAYETHLSKTLRQILSYLKRFPDFRTSNKKVVLYSESGQLKVNGAIKDLAVNFEDVDETMVDQYKLFWGVIVNAENEFQNNGIWLNSNRSKRGLSIKIYEDIRDRFLQAFKIEELEALEGAHVLVAGKMHYSGKNNKPIVYCAMPNFITIQKYREVTK